MQHLYTPTLESATVTRANIKNATSKKPHQIVKH